MEPSTVTILHLPDVAPLTGKQLLVTQVVLEPVHVISCLIDRQVLNRYGVVGQIDPEYLEHQVLCKNRINVTTVVFDVLLNVALTVSA